MKKEISYKIISLIFSILVVCFAIGFYVYAVWTEPGAPPPGGNVDAPLNVGSEEQIKQGNLVVNALGVSATGNALLVPNGNVGIGTTGPDTKLHIYDDGIVNTELKIESVQKRSFVRFDQIGTREWLVGAANDFDASGEFLIKDVTANACRFFIDSTGNVGIGTTSPSVGEETLKLDVEGPVGATKYCDENGNNCKTITEIGGGFSGFGEWTDIDSAGATLTRNNVYKVTSGGFVIFRNDFYATVNHTIGYTDSDNPPTTERALASEHNTDAEHTVMMPVRKDDYWRVTTNYQLRYLYWLPFGSGQCVKQFLE